MPSKLKQACEDGILLGVKWGIVVFCLAVSLLLLMGDYTQVRQRAQRGQDAYEFIQQQIQNAQKAAAPK